MLYGYGYVNNHMPTLKATAMRGGGSSNPLNTGLYAVYKAESNANDSLGTYNGTAQGGLTYSGGKSGNAFTFNGTNAYVSLPRTSSQFDFTGDFSISIWMKQSADGNIFENFYGTSTTVRYGYNLYTQSGRIRFAIYTGTATHLGECSTPIVTNTMYHIVITKTTSSAYKTYVNGNLATTSTVSGNITNNPVYNALNQVNIGSDVYNGSRNSYYNGQIDELNIWNRELTSTEVTEVYNTGTGKFYPY